MFNEIQGDLFEHLPKHTEKGHVVIPHVVNDKGKWASGFVLPLAKSFPQAKQDYLGWSSSGCLEMGQLWRTQVDKNIAIAHMVGQTLSGKRPHVRDLYYNHLVYCMTGVARLPWKFEIVCPRFGAGLAGGNWEFIKELINDCWVKAGIPVTVYYL
jgi:hypothetical protein